MDFAELYDRYFNKVYNYVRYHVRLAAEADERVVERRVQRPAEAVPAEGGAVVAGFHAGPIRTAGRWRWRRSA